tara:strand:+ start:309 stop:926 length:618 start_codon:yes stop_codon:yes gene_type:complete
MAYNKTPFKMMGKSPMMKALVGKQNNLPDALKEKILASPAKQMEPESAGTTDAMRKKVRQESTGATDALTGKKAARKARKARKQEEMKQDSIEAGKMKSGTKDVMTGSPAKKYKSAAQRKAVHASKADGGKGSPAKKYGKSPAKAHCSSPAKQAKSKKEMKYDKTAQKAENAAVSGKVRKNSRLVNKANKIDKKNNIGKGKIAKM